MKYLCVVLAFATIGLAAERPKTVDCFKVNWLLRADEEHYWANWTNKCSYTIDSVYVMVLFADEGNQSLGNGVWGLHFVTPGQSRVTRFSTPARVPDFHSVHIRKITTNSEEALRPNPLEQRASVPDRPTGDHGPQVKPPRPSATLVAEHETGQ